MKVYVYVLSQFCSIENDSFSVIKVYTTFDDAVKAAEQLWEEVRKEDDEDWDNDHIHWNTIKTEDEDVDYWEYCSENFYMISRVEMQ